MARILIGVVIGSCELILHLPDNHSLKGKRQVSRSLVQRIRNRFNVAIAEVADQDQWQVLSLGVSCVSDNARHIDEILSKVIDFIDDQNSGAVLHQTRVEIIRV